MPAHLLLIGALAGGAMMLGSTAISSMTSLKQTKMMIDAGKDQNKQFNKMWEGQLSSGRQNMGYWQQQAGLGGPQQGAQQFGQAPQGYYPQTFA